MPTKSIPQTYIHPDPPSFSARSLQFAMSLVGWKNKMARQMKNKPILSRPAKPQSSLRKNFEVTTAEHSGRPVWTVTAKKNTTAAVVLYLHGGGYVNNILSFHWKLIEKLASLTRATIVVPDYPLAPQESYQEVFAFMESLYADLRLDHPDKKIVFMGDSAGAGLALALAQKLRKTPGPQPNQIILLSPLLDITMSNPEIKEVEKQDKMLTVEGVKLTSEAYANGLDSENYLVSPLFGEFFGLGEISIFIGTHDLFLADSRKLKRKLEGESIPVNYFEYPGMFHVWMVVTFLKEARLAIKQIAELVKE